MCLPIVYLHAKIFLKKSLAQIMKHNVAEFWSKPNPNLLYVPKNNFLEKLYQDLFVVVRTLRH